MNSLLNLKGGSSSNTHYVKHLQNGVDRPTLGHLVDAFGTTLIGIITEDEIATTKQLTALLSNKQIKENYVI